MSKTLFDFLSNHQPLTETTVPDHLQHISETWDHHSNVDDATQEKMSKALKGKTFITFPLNHSTNQADPDVEEHLSKHGYAVKDYAKGIATIKKQVGDPSKGIPMREKYIDEKIGSVLDKTGASKELKSTFQNDPTRTTSKNPDDLHVCITTNPLGIAGMSTGTNWTSCMNLHDGQFRNHLRDDSEHGTHVAYLVKATDHSAMAYGQPDHPIARIALKPFHKQNEYDDPDKENPDTVFRPEGSSYGNSSTHFKNAVNQWAAENYPAQAGQTYRKNRHVYDDDSNLHFREITKDEVERAVKNGHGFTDKLDLGMTNHAFHVFDEHQKSLTDPTEKNEALRSFTGAMLGHGNLQSHHVNKLYSMLDDGQSVNFETRRALGSHQGDKLSTNNLLKHIDDIGGHENLTIKALGNPKLPDDIVDQLSPENLARVRPRKIKPHHMDKVVDSYMNNESGSFYNVRDLKDHLNEDHLMKLATKSNANSIVSTHPKLTQKVHDAVIDYHVNTNAVSPHERTRIIESMLQNSKFASLNDVDKTENLKSTRFMPALAKNEHIDQKPFAEHFIKYGTKEMIGNYIPSNLGKHFGKDQFEKMHANGMSPMFESPEHSEKYIRHLMDKAHEHDDALTKHLDSKYDEDDYDEEEDDDAVKLRNNLHHTLGNMSYVLDNHIRDHVEGEDGGIKDHVAHGFAYEVLHGNSRTKHSLNSLDNYKTPENSDRYDEHEHYDDYFSTAEDKLKNISEYDEF